MEKLTISSDTSVNHTDIFLYLTIKGKRLQKKEKALAVLLYSTGKASYGFITRLFNVSRTAVLKWMKSIGKGLPEPSVDTEIKEVQIDEMWHFLNEKKRKIWIWRASNCSTKETVGWVIGDRSIKNT